jgi:hypothetical protein
MSGGIQPDVVRLPSRRRRREAAPTQPSLVALEAELRTIEIAIGALAARRKGVLSAYRRVLKQTVATMFILLILVGSTVGRQHCRSFRLYPGVVPQGLIVCFNRRAGPIRSRS